MSYGTPDHQPYIALAQEIMRRAYAEEDPPELNRWLAATVARLGGAGVDDSAVMTWEESFEYTRQMLEKFERDAMLAPDQRVALDWCWDSWNGMIDAFEPGMLCTLFAGDGMGKCLGKGTKVVMFDGTLRTVEDVRAGDLLMGPDSKPRRVLALGYGVEQMYWVRQNSGISYRANGAHILALMKRDKKGNKTHAELTIDEVRKLPEWYVKRHLQGYKTDVDFLHSDVPLDPYFLGLWLGDGFKHTGAIFTADNEVVNYLQDYATKKEIGISIQPDKPGEKCLRVMVGNGQGGGRHRKVNDPGMILSGMGLLGDKRIPQEYIANSEVIRLGLLAGLVDSDGYYDTSSKSYEITQTIEPLARQIKFVADSLGFRTSIQERTVASQLGTESQVWRIRIMGDVERIPVLIERKKATARTINKDWRVTGIQIEPDKVDEFFGFKIDGDGLFLLEDMTVTHNTIVAECLGEHWSRRRKRVVFLHYELNRSLMMLRRLARHTGFAVKLLKGAKTPEQKRIVNLVEPKLRAWDGGIEYVHTPGWSMSQTVQKLMALKNNGKCDVVITDYIEKVAADRRQMQLFGRDPYQREADNVEQLKNFAESSETPVLMLAQASKGGKGKKEVEDMDRSDMRGAGEKSEKANIVIKLHRERIAEGERDENNPNEWIIHPNGYGRKTTILVDKQTLGATGSFEQFMEPQYFRLHDVTRREVNK